MTNKPKRTFELTLTIGADTLDDDFVERMALPLFDNAVCGAHCHT